MSASPKLVGPFIATTIVAGNMIGSGIFLLPASLARVGSASLIGWGIAAFGAIILALVYGLLATHRPSGEAIVDYPGKALHPIAGLVSSLSYWAACWIGNTAILLAAVGYLSGLLGLEFEASHQMIILIGMIWLVAVLNLIGPNMVGLIGAATLCVGLLPIVAVISVAMVHFDPVLFSASWNISGEPLGVVTPPIVLTIFWAFLGLESASALNNIVRNPARNIPLAAIAGTAIAALVYALACSSLFGLMPAGDLATSTAPFADAIIAYVGPVAAGLVALTAFARTFGCGTTWVLVTVELNNSAARAGFLPKFVSGADASSSRQRDIFFVSILMTLTSLATVSPSLNQQFNTIIDISVLMFMLVYFMSSLSLVVFANSFTSGKSRTPSRLAGLAGMIVALGVTAGYFVV